MRRVTLLRKHERARDGESLALDKIVKNISELPTESTKALSFEAGRISRLGRNQTVRSW